MLGLAEMRAARSDATSARQRDERALNHFLIAHELAEALRRRFPEDVVGLTRAGFLARRAYVNEKIVELYVRSGRPDEALKSLRQGGVRNIALVLVELAGCEKSARRNQQLVQLVDGDAELSDGAGAGGSLPAAR